MSKPEDKPPCTIICSHCREAFYILDWDGMTQQARHADTCYLGKLAVSEAEQILLLGERNNRNERSE